MRPFRLTTLVTGVAVSALLALFPGHPVLADLLEPVPLQTRNGNAICRSEDIVIGPEFSAMSEDMCREHAKKPTKRPAPAPI